MLGPSAVTVSILHKPMSGKKSADDWTLLYSDVEIDPPTPMATDADLLALVEVPEQHFQCWTEDTRKIERGYKLVWDVSDDETREYLIKDLTDSFDLPVGQTSRRLHLVRWKK